MRRVRSGPGSPPGRAAENARRILHRVRERLPSSWNHPPLSSEDVPEKQEGDLRLLTLNLAHGRVKGHQFVQTRNRMEQHLDLVASTLRRATPDVVGLQEADGPSSWSGDFDHVAELSSLAGLEHHYHGDHNRVDMGPVRLKWGTALLSRLTQVAKRSDALLKSISVGSEFNYETVTAIREIRDAARAITDLTDLIQRRPNSIILGK